MNQLAEQSNRTTLQDMFDTLDSSALDALVTAENQAALRALTASFPHDVAAYFGFEVRLRPPVSMADFAFNLSNNGLRWFAEGEHPWANIGRFCRLWGESGQPPYGDGPRVWLEFDAQSSADVPSIFVGLAESAAHIPTRSLTWLCQEGIPALRGSALAASVEANLRHCKDSLPPQTDLVQVGLMLSRNVDAVRFCGFQFGPDDILPFLQSIGWPGDVRMPLRLAENYASVCDQFCVHVDVGSRVYPTLGLELLFGKGGRVRRDPWHLQPQFEPRWHELFDRLIADGYCHESRRAALLNWPQRIERQTPLIERLIATLNAEGASDGYNNLPDGVLVLGLQHVKFSLKPAGSVTAKCYLGARYDVAQSSEPLAGL